MTEEKLLKGRREHVAEVLRRNYEGIEGLKAEITEEEYIDALEVLPPLDWHSKEGYFYMREFLIGDLTDKYSRIDGKYYVEVADFRKEHKDLTPAAYRGLRYFE